MKRTILYFLLLIGIFSCNKQEPKIDKQKEENFALIKEYTKHTYMTIAKLHTDYDIEDDYNAEIYDAAKNIYEKCDSIHIKLLNLKSENNPEVLKLKSQEYFDEFIKTVDSAPNLGQWKDNVLLANSTSDIDNNILNLWIFSAKLMLKLSNELTPFCGILGQFKLSSTLEKNLCKVGDTIRVYSFFERNKDRIFSTPLLYTENPLNIKEIKLSNSIIKPKNLISRFENRYIEFVPTKIGNYSITFSKTIERVNKKIEPYESKVEFTVLPK